MAAHGLRGLGDNAAAPCGAVLYAVWRALPDLQVSGWRTRVAPGSRVAGRRVRVIGEPVKCRLLIHKLRLKWT